MYKEIKKIAAIHDLSCFGRCALTVVIPTLSAMGNQVIPVPTALLSTHTGDFEGFYFHDLTESMTKISDHFSRLELTFDAVYTGFLGSAAQIKIVEDFIGEFAPENTLVLVDPVMGDNGKLYSTYTEEMAKEMGKLCSMANVITPNLTEACFLTGTKYLDTANFSENEVREYLHVISERLAGFGAARQVITGVPHSKDKFATFCSEVRGEKREEFLYSPVKVDIHYPGTGDLFACVLLGGLMREGDFFESAKFAADFTRRVMEYTKTISSTPRNGVAFEKFLGELV